MPQPWSKEALQACQRAARWLGFTSIEEASWCGWSLIMLVEAQAELERA